MRTFKVEKDFVVDGYRCVITGSSLGHRCGYIGLPKDHPLYGKDYDDIDIRVHGGLTFADDGDGVYPVESDLWWIGFDCAHYGDGKDFDMIKELASEREYQLMMELEMKLDGKYSTREYETIRTLEYVEQELINAVKQITSLIKLPSFLKWQKRCKNRDKLCAKRKKSRRRL